MSQNFSVEIFKRDQITPLVFEGVAFQVQRYSGHVWGGPKRCTIRANGALLDLQRLLDCIRCGLNVKSADGRNQWWGMIASVEIYDAGLVYGFTLDNMANDINCIYTEQSINQRYSSLGTQAETGFTDDDASVAEYGRMQKRVRLANMGTDAAISKQTQELNYRKRPMQIYRAATGMPNQKPYAMIYCRGWFDSLAFRYYENSSGNPAGFEKNDTPTVESEQFLGRAHPAKTTIQFIATNQILAQNSDLAVSAERPFNYIFIEGSASNNQPWVISAMPEPGRKLTVTTTPNVANESAGASVTVKDAGQKIYMTFELEVNSPFYATAIDIPIRKEGNPTDDVNVKLYTDNSGVPNTLLATGVIDNVEISKSMEWITAVLDTPSLLSYGTVYGIEISRSGSAALDCFVVLVDEGLNYSRGSMKLYTNATHGWKTRPTNADLPFRVSGQVETTTQIENIVDDVGEFITSVQIIDDSNVLTPPYRDGESTALELIKKLLDTGTDNYRRLLALVDADRRLIVYEEPVAGSNQDFLISRGEIRTAADAEIDDYTLPYGQWSKVKELQLTNIDITDRFIDEVEYDAINDRIIQIIPRGERLPVENLTALE